MKVLCNSCGVHFDTDFEKTLSPNCQYWKQSGGETLSVESKKEFWDWVFKTPADQIYLRDGHALNTNTWFEKIDDADRWENFVPNYKAWPDEIRRRFQEEFVFFRKTQNRLKANKFSLQEFIKANSEWKKFVSPSFKSHQRPKNRSHRT